MSTNPYQPPAEVIEPFDPSHPARPTAVTVFGILNLLFGAFGVCCLGFSAAAMFIPFGPEMSRDNVPLQLMEESPLYRNFNRAEMVLGIAASIVLIVAGIGLLRLRPWGRKLAIGYGIYSVATDVIASIINLGFVFPILFQKAESASGIAMAAVWIALFSGIAATVCGLTYAGLLLYFMYRPNVVAAFNK
jgi:hypothetical protein